MTNFLKIYDGGELSVINIDYIMGIDQDKTSDGVHITKLTVDKNGDTYYSGHRSLYGVHIGTVMEVIEYKLAGFGDGKIYVKELR